MRTQMLFNLRCSKCGAYLEVDDHPEWHASKKDEGDNAFLHGGSAYHMQATLKVRPCEQCIENETAPARKIKQALSEMDI